MEIEQGKRLILRAFWELAWAKGQVDQAQVDFITKIAQEMGLSLGERLPNLIRGLSRAADSEINNLGDVPIDDVERYELVERFVAFCLLGEGLESRQADILARLSIQLGITADELEEMRRRLCSVS